MATLQWAAPPGPPHVPTIDTTRRTKRLREDDHWVTPKRRKTYGSLGLEVPADIEDIEIPLEDMGDGIILTRL